MSKPSILILDDDEMWLARHERRLTQAGFKCFATQSATEAISLGKSQTSIKFALIDEILFVPPVPSDISQAELQRWQGSGVIREITNLRRDIQFIIVTSAPQLRSHGDLQLFTRETSKLRRQTNVIDIIHKQDIEADPDREYRWLIEDIFNRPQLDADLQQNLKPRVILGLGFEDTTFAAMSEQIDRKRTNYLPLAPFLANLPHPEKFTNQLIDRCQEKCIFIEAPGSKKLDRTSFIKADSQSYQILQTLALQSELHQPVTIREADYKFTPRTTKETADIDADIDTRSVTDFAYEYSDSGKHLSDGVQLEYRPKPSSRLKVAISRLKQDLAKANVAPPDTLFTTDRDGYAPTFELGITIYLVKQGKKHRK
jgi:CheY-like chemotaxis protein